MSLRTSAAVAFLAGQAVLVIGGLFHEGRWFTWAPHTAQVRYRIEATVDGRSLTTPEIARRLGLPAAGWEAHAARNLKDVIEQYARTYGRDERLTVTLHYSVNGRAEERWAWPADGGR